MPNQYAGDLCIKFFLNEEARKALEQHAEYVPYKQGRASGYGHTCKMIVLNDLNVGYVDHHAAQMEEAQQKALDEKKLKEAEIEAKAKKTVAKSKTASKAAKIGDDLKSKLKKISASKKKK